MKWLSSLDELLYEVMGWAVFLPLTLWRTATQPLQMMAYAEEQLALPPEDRFDRALRPPLFLALVMLASHGVSTALGEQDAVLRNQHGLGAAIRDDTSALVLRILCFAIFPLVMSVLFIAVSRRPLTRATLKPGFYAQCYPAATFALFESTGVALATIAGTSTFMSGAAVALIAVGLGYYLSTESRWLKRRLGRGYVSASLIALGGLFIGLALLFGVGLLFTR